MSTYLGDFPADQAVYFMWNSNDVDGASITRSTDGTISVYKDNSDGSSFDQTQVPTGVTDDEDVDGLTGVHSCCITTTDAWYETGHDYVVVLSAATIDGQTVNAVLATFSIENRFAEVDLTHILGHLLTQTGTQLADAFEHFFDVATPTGTVDSLPAADPGATGGLPVRGGAIPDAAADAAGGLPISDAGGLDLDNRMPSAVAITNLDAYYDGTREVLYVRKSGNDANDGSGEGSAFLTIQAAIDVSTDGDTIDIGRGTWSEMLNLKLPAKKLTLVGVGVDATIVTYVGTTFNSYGGVRLAHMRFIGTGVSGKGVDIRGDDVELDHVVGEGVTDGIYIEDATRVRVKDCDAISDWDGLRITNCDDVIVENSTGYTDGSDDVGRNAHGIAITSTSGVIINCVGRAVRANAATGRTVGAILSDELTVVGGWFSASVTDADATGDVNAIRSLGVTVINASTSSDNSGSGGEYDLMSSSGTLAVSNTQYDHAKTSGTITDLDEQAVANVMDDAIPGSPTADSINERVAAVDDKLPTNYIMGSDDVDDHNDELEDWADGGRLDELLDAKPTVTQFNARSLPTAAYFVVSDYTVPPTVTQINTKLAAAHGSGSWAAAAVSKTGYSLAAGGLDGITATEVTAKPTNFREWVMWLAQRFRRAKLDREAGTLTVETEAGAVVTTQATTDDGTTQQLGKPS